MRLPYPPALKEVSVAQAANNKVVIAISVVILSFQDFFSVFNSVTRILPYF
jgi:hypothetical protein